jgi:hypothetical protein
MKTLRTVAIDSGFAFGLAVALAAGAVAIATPRRSEDTLTFTPKKELELRKEFVESSKWRLSELETIVNDSPVAGPVPTMDGETTRKLVVLDRYAELGAGRPKSLTRKFEELAGDHSFDFEVQGLSDSIQLRLSSPLVETKVEFTREGDSEATKANFTGDASGDPLLLAGLVEDLDLRAFLPDEDMGVEDTWEIAPERFARVIAPGGALHFGPDKGGVPASDALDPLEIVSTALFALAENTAEPEGDVTVTWVETKQVEGRSVAVLEIDWDSRSKGVLAERAAEMLAASGASSQRTDVAVNVLVICEGEGKLLWDLAARHAHSFELELRTSYEAELFWSQGGQRNGYKFKLSGESKLAASFAQP